MSRSALVLATLLALVAFAVNSLLCRLALKGGGIDAASFTSLRIASGALVLVLVIVMLRRFFGARHQPARGGRSALALRIAQASNGLLASGRFTLSIYSAVGERCLIKLQSVVCPHEPHTTPAAAGVTFVPRQNTHSLPLSSAASSRFPLTFRIVAMIVTNRNAANRMSDFMAPAPR